MNVTELARKLKVPTKELLELLPSMGIDIGRRAIKINDSSAHKILKEWPRFYAHHKAKTREEEKQEEKSAIKKKILLPEFITIKEFAMKSEIPVTRILTVLMKNGMLLSMNEKIDFDTAEIISGDLGLEIEKEAASHERETAEEAVPILADEDMKKLQPRPPVVVIMGHVDHGKTKLLDTIRKTNIAEFESGGITQHMGAYQIEVRPKGEPKSRAPLKSEGSPVKEKEILRSAQDDFVRFKHKITFIDTPGHEAFTTMRSRGARVADIAVLVIAADDGMKPQTKESIRIIQSANIPMVVAINKIDKPEANIEKVKQELAQENLLPEDWGGKTLCQGVSAKTGKGVDELLDAVLLVAEMEKEKISANPDREAVGTIIESHIDKGEGPVATVLVQNGTLKIGDFITLGGNFYGKVRGLKDFLGKSVELAPPSMPIKILGLKGIPAMGDILTVKKEFGRRTKIKSYHLKTQAAAVYAQAGKKEKKEIDETVNFILRTDVLGSLEAIMGSLDKLTHPDIELNIVGKGLGNITENDVLLAEDNHAVILGFHSVPTPAAQSLAQEKNIEIKTYKIIYELLDEIKKRVEEKLKPLIEKIPLGKLKVLKVFKKDKSSIILGGRVMEGKISVRAKLDIVRNGEVRGQGNIAKLQENRVDVNTVSQGHECGIQYEGKGTVEEGDILEAYQEEITQKKIDKSNQ